MESENKTNRLWIDILFEKIPLNFFWSNLIIYIIVLLINVILFSLIDIGSISNYFSIGNMLALFSPVYLLCVNKYLIDLTRTTLNDAKSYYKKEYNPTIQFNYMIKKTKIINLMAFFTVLISLYYSNLGFNRSLIEIFLPWFELTYSKYGILLDIFNFIFTSVFALSFVTFFRLFFIFFNIMIKTANITIYSELKFKSYILENTIATYRKLIYKYFFFAVGSIYFYFINMITSAYSYWEKIKEILIRDIIFQDHSNYINLDYPFSLQLSIIFFLLVLTIIFLISPLNNLRILLENIRSSEAQAIKLKYYSQIQELVNYAPSTNLEENLKELNYLQSYIDALEKTYDRINKANQRNNFKYYIRFIIVNIGTIIATIVIPIVTAFKLVLDIFNNMKPN